MTARPGLEALLLRCGGQRVELDSDLCPRTIPEEEGEVLFLDDAALLLSGGRLVPADTRVEFRAGRPCACHANAAALFGEFCDDDRLDERLDLVTGYALGEDGVWRRHSWAQRRDGTVVETTEPRTAYFGVTLDPSEQLNEGGAWMFVALHRE